LDRLDKISETLTALAGFTGAVERQLNALTRLVEDIDSRLPRPQSDS
jgi:hypothetical protein